MGLLLITVKTGHLINVLINAQLKEFKLLWSLK